VPASGAREDKSGHVTGSCGKCKRKLNFGADVLYLKRNFDFDLLARSRQLAVKEVERVDAAPDPEASTAPEPLDPKIEKLLEIIRGTATNGERKELTYLGMLANSEWSNPLPADAPRKVLVFANYSESLSTIERELGRAGIDYVRLGGTPNEIAKRVAKFHETGTVMLINSERHCAGLNLQHCCTDLVFYHRVQNVHIEGQVCGRAMRIGRQYDLNVHCLFYKGENKQ
jgi:SNF2 family DNA or RNA helicase